MDIDIIPNGVSLFVQIIATSMLFLVVSVFFVKPMRSFLAKRQEFVQAEFNRATEASNDAIKLKIEADNELKSFREEKKKLMDEARDAMTKEREYFLGKASETALLEAKKVQVDMYDKTLGNIADIVTNASETLIKKEIDASVHEDLFADFVKQVGGQDE